MTKDITRELVLNVAQHQGHRRVSRDADDRYIAKLTHLHLNGQGINSLNNMLLCPKLEVLYLYDNALSCLDGIELLQNVTHLYLQNNSIVDISPIGNLKSLEKLYLDGNCISDVAGIGSCANLEELQVSNQRLRSGEVLVFDSSTMYSLAESLRILVGRNNKLSSIRELFGMAQLRKLDLANNNVYSLEDLESLLASCPQLIAFDLRGNPVCKAPKYRDSVIMMSDYLRVLDDEPITKEHREFLLRLQIQKLKMDHSSKDIEPNEPSVKPSQTKQPWERQASASHAIPRPASTHTPDLQVVSRVIRPAGTPSIFTNPLGPQLHYNNPNARSFSTNKVPSQPNPVQPVSVQLYQDHSKPRSIPSATLEFDPPPLQKVNSSLGSKR